MDRKELVSEIGRRLKMVRRHFGYSQDGMAHLMNTGTTSYYRNELGTNCPGIWPQYMLAKEMKVSLDWLVCNRGKMIYEEPKKEEPPKAEEPKTPEMEILSDDLRNDVKELLDHMEHIPLLRYEVLTLLHRFKEEHKDIVASAMKNKDKEGG